MIEQIAIGLLGVTAVFLSQSAHASQRKWACIFGLLAQPFWFYATWHAEQWGIFALCFLYAFSWMRGVYTNWIKPPKDPGNSNLIRNIQALLKLDERNALVPHGIGGHARDLLEDCMKRLSR